MARSREFVDYLMELMVGLGEVRARAMFGGFGIYHDDLMFALVADEVLYVKVDDESKPTFEAAGGEPFRLESKNAVMAYYTVPDAALDDAEIMMHWARLGVDAAMRAKPRKRSRLQ